MGMPAQLSHNTSPVASRRAGGCPSSSRSLPYHDPNRATTECPSLLSRGQRERRARSHPSRPTKSHATFYAGEELSSHAWAAPLHWGSTDKNHGALRSEGLPCSFHSLLLPLLYPKTHSCPELSERPNRSFSKDKILEALVHYRRRLSREISTQPRRMSSRARLVQPSNRGCAGGTMR